MKHETQSALVIAGPTASGKTALGVQLAGLLNGEILSADSRQVYRGLDIGSGKDLSEYVFEGKPLPYHLIDIAEVTQEFSVFHYKKAFYPVYDGVCRRGRLPVIVGGTGLYLEAILRNYHLPAVPENPALRKTLAPLDDEALIRRLRSLKPDMHDEMDLSSRERMIRAIEIAEGVQNAPEPPRSPLQAVLMVVLHDPDTLRERIARRLRFRLDNGLIEEVDGLHHRGISWERLDALGLEYRFCAQHLQGHIPNKNDLFQKLNSAIAQFAKRQRTWFRGMERRGLKVHWLPDTDTARALAVIKSVSQCGPGGSPG